MKVSSKKPHKKGYLKSFLQKYQYAIWRYLLPNSHLKRDFVKALVAGAEKFGQFYEVCESTILFLNRIMSTFTYNSGGHDSVKLNHFTIALYYDVTRSVVLIYGHIYLYDKRQQTMYQSACNNSEKYTVKNGIEQFSYFFECIWFKIAS